MEINFNKKYNILISGVNGLGTNLFFIPFIKLLKIKFKNSRLILLTWQNNNFFKFTDFFDEIIEIKQGRVDQEIKINNIDFYFLRVEDDEKNDEVIRPNVKVDFRKKYLIEDFKDSLVNDYLNQYVESLPINHIAKVNVKFLYEIFGFNDRVVLDALLFEEAYLNKHKNNQDKIVSICLGNWSNQYGLLEESYYVDLINWCQKKYPDIRFLLIGKGKDEKDRANKIIKKSKDSANIVNLVNVLDLKSLLKVLLKSTWVVGQDTGVVHLASCLDKNIFFLANNKGAVLYRTPVSQKNNQLIINDLNNDSQFNPNVLSKYKLFS